MGGFKENIGKNIVRLRKLHGLSQEQMAHEAGVARDKISKMEGGASNITMETLEKLCTFLVRPQTTFCCRIKRMKNPATMAQNI